MEFKYKDFGDFLSQKKYPKADDLDSDQIIQYNGEYLKEMREHQTEMQKEALENQAEELKEAQEKALKELEEKVRETMAKQVETLLGATKTQGEAIEKLMSKGGVIEVLSPYQKSIEDNMDKIKEGASHPHTEKREFVVNLSQKADFTAASVVNNTDALRLQDIGQLAHRKISVWDSLPKIPVPKDANGTIRYTDWDEATKVRAAAVLAEGGTFPESTAAFEEFSISLKKIGDTIPITEESLFDRARFAAELNLFLLTNVDLVSDQQAYDGDGTGNNLTGFFTTATTFVAVASSISDASIYDLFVKVREAMTAGKDSKVMPNVAYMNIIDINAYKLKKDANENYVMPPFVSENGRVIDGITVIESNAVTSNSMVMADNRFIRVYEEPGMFVSTGLVASQFIQDLVTLKARRRAQVLVRNADEIAVFKVTDIAAALVTLAL